jgi:formylglycine-generating enzyme required for sulfatase activity
MAHWRVWFKCIGAELIAKGLREIPVVGWLVEVAAGVAERLRKEMPRETDRRAALQDLAQAADQQIRQEAEAVAQVAAAGEPLAVRQRLTAYLMHVPAVVKKSLQRPEDPKGTTVPATWHLDKAEDLLPLLPARVPRFKAGDRPLPGVDWELEQLLGVGGFGEVWKARDPHFASVPPAALKFCLDPTAKARLLRREAAILDQIMTQVKHPGFVALRHTYLSADPPCLEYEYISGGDLTGVIQKWHQKPPADLVERALKTMRALTEIVAAAHRLAPPIVHRDLKPANILVQPKGDGTSVLRVADLGIGAVAAAQALVQTKSGTTQAAFLGESLRGSHSPLYASPQQSRGDDPDPRDDVHALGVIWLQMLTGNLLSGAPSGRRWQERLQKLGLSGPAIDLLASCVEPLVEDRPASAAILAEQLAALGQRAVPLMAIPVTPPPLLQTPVEEPPRRAAPTAPPAPGPARPKTPIEQRPRRRPPAPEIRGGHKGWWAAGAVSLVLVLLPLFLFLNQQNDPSRSKGDNKDKGGAKNPPLVGEIDNSIGMKLVRIPHGTFWMGSPETEPERSTNEKQHEVVITKDFYLGMYEVTQKEFQRVMGYNPSYFSLNGKGRKGVNYVAPPSGGRDKVVGSSDTYPVENVSWHEAKEFCAKLSALDAEQKAGRKYRLPTEAEWEYACRGGATSPFHFGNALSGKDANFDSEFPYGGAAKSPSLQRTTTVGSYPANGFRLHDMHGNVWEWCEDWYDENYYNVSPREDPPGPTNSKVRVLRGGSWNFNGRNCRAACRSYFDPGGRGGIFGFRVVLVVAPRTP